MDSRFTGFSDYTDGFQINDQNLLPASEQFSYLSNDSTNGFEVFDRTSFPSSNHFLKPASPGLDLMENYLSMDDLNQVVFDPSVSVTSASLSSDSGSLARPTGFSPGVESSSDDSEFSDNVLGYINQILLEENMEDKPSLFYDPLELKITEKSFYDVIGEQYPLSPHQPPFCSETPDDSMSASASSVVDHGDGSATSASNPAISQLLLDPQDGLTLSEYPVPREPVYLADQRLGSQFSVNSTNGLASSGDELVRELLANNIFSNRESVSQYMKGVEEASKFLPVVNNLIVDIGNGTAKGDAPKEVETAERGKRTSPNDSRGRKNHERDDGFDLDSEEGRSSKQSAIHEDESELSEMFDRILLYGDRSSLCSPTDCPMNGLAKKLQQGAGKQGSNSGKGRAKRQGKRNETTDLSSLLILCAQAVSTDDRRTANELLKQIRQHSSPDGDGSQRLAHYFANALEARLAGTGTGTKLFFASLASTKASDILRGFQTHLSACPFKRLSIIFSNKMILKAAEGAEALHIVDFGICYGFQWPIVIQFLSQRPGGPPKLKITAIDNPQPGFRPAERIEETGRRLKGYCDRFNVPFEYHAIPSQNWETIQLKDLKLDKNEVLAVNCLFRFKHLLEESVEGNGPRNAVLELIRKMNPNIFVHTIVNGSYNAPFFITRFREALFYFASMYDMFDTTLPRDSEGRMMFEREFLGREIMNVVACEGLERVERPETYKQWHLRCSRAGFKQHPVEQELLSQFRSRLSCLYDRNFVLDQDGHWLLQGWKGRIVYASSCWVPA